MSSKSDEKRPTLILTTSVQILYNRSDRYLRPAQDPPVRPVPPTGQTGPSKTEGLHTQPSSVQPADFLAYWSLSTTCHPSVVRQMNLAQQGQKSTSWGPEIIWVAINSEQLILSKTYPTSGYNLAHIPRHARLSSW